MPLLRKESLTSHESDSESGSFVWTIFCNIRSLSFIIGRIFQSLYSTVLPNAQAKLFFPTLDHQNVCIWWGKKLILTPVLHSAIANTSRAFLSDTPFLGFFFFFLSENFKSRKFFKQLWFVTKKSICFIHSSNWVWRFNDLAIFRKSEAKKSYLKKGIHLPFSH